MGRQINFFLAQDDEAPFEALLRSVGPFAILPGHAANPAPSGSTRVERMGEERLKVFLTMPDYTCPVLPVDVERLPVVEFFRCYRGPGFIRTGRLYFVTQYYDDAGVMISKDSTFIAWGDALIRKARRWMKRVDEISYAGPVAAHAAKSGSVELRHS